MLLALSLTTGAVVFVGLIFATIFRYVDPAIVVDDYRPCAGGWYESELNDCAIGLFRIPQQPVNTYSNLAYLASGMFVALLLDTAPGFVFAVTMAYLCIGSTLYHATSTRWAGMLDVTGIYVVFSALAVYAMTAVFSTPSWLTSTLMFVVSGLIAYVLSPRYHDRMHLRIGLFLGATYAFSLIQMWASADWGPSGMLLGSLALFATAFGIWKMDRARTFPLKRWGHGFWHVLTAAASGILFYAIHLGL